MYPPIHQFMDLESIEYQPWMTWMRMRSTPTIIITRSYRTGNTECRCQHALQRLLLKFFDEPQFDFDYEQSGLWSPPVPRTVFLSSPGRIFTEQEMLERLRSKSAPNHRRKIRVTCFSVFCCS